MTRPLWPGFPIVAGFVAAAMLPVLAQDRTPVGVNLPSDANRPKACDPVGEVFGANQVDHAVTIKSDRDSSMVTMRLSETTQIVRQTTAAEAGGTFDPKNIQIGDRLCVEQGDSSQRTVRILLMTRSDMQTQQQRMVSILRHNSAFGVITSLSNDGHVLRLDEALDASPETTSRPITVQAGDLVAFRHYSPKATAGSEGTVTKWDDLHTGDQIYVEGVRDSDSQTIHAEVIISGGVRGVFGIVKAVNGLDEALDLQEIGSTSLTIVRIHPEALFRATPLAMDSVSGNAPANAAPLTLHPIIFADLQKGDSIAVLGRVNNNPRQVSGLMAATSFGSFGLNPPTDPDPVIRFLDPLRRPR